MIAEDAVALGASGRIAPNVALARAILAGASEEDIARALKGATGPGADAMRRLFRARRGAMGTLVQAARAIDHTTQGAAALEPLRAGFDRAARVAPEASVAFYTLGDSALMADATREIVQWMRAGELLHPACDVLDIGCGIGRVAAALAPYVRSVLGVDIAPEMIRLARARHGGEPRLRFQEVHGDGILPTLSGSSPAWDIVLAVDSFPYLVQSGVAVRHVADAGRVLRPAGALVIINLSYRGGTLDREDAGRWAARYGFHLRCNGVQPFKLWDGSVFVFQRLRAAG